MVLLQKWPFFQLFFLGNIGQENVFYDILEPKSTFLGYKNEKFKTLKNWHFSEGLTHAGGPKMATFLTFFFRQYRPGKCVLWYSRTKKHLYRLQKHKVQKVQNWHFSKGVNPWFLSKNGHFSNFFLGSIGKENVFYDILEPKNTFLGYKNTKFKKSKTRYFFKGVNPLLWSKNGHFSNFFF